MSRFQKVKLVTPSSNLAQSSDGMLVRKGDFDPIVDALNAIIPDASNSDALSIESLVTSGDITVGDDLAVTGDAVITGTLSAAASTLGALNYKQQVTDTGGAYATPVVLTAAQSGRVVLVDDAAGLDFTLPAIGASDIGMVFDFLVTVSVTSNNFRVTAAAGDLLNGGVLSVDFDAAYTAPQIEFFEPDFTNDLIMTCNGTTTGGKKGTRIKFEAVSATQWFVTGTLVGDGVLATPFS